MAAETPDTGTGAFRIQINELSTGIGINPAGEKGITNILGVIRILC